MRIHPTASGFRSGVAAPGFVVVSLFVLGAPPEAAVQPADPLYRVISSKESAFQQDLDRAAAEGYRLVHGDASVEFAVMERAADGQARTYLFAPNLEEVLTQKKLEPGFRLLGPTFYADRFHFSAIFEKAAGDDRQREYRLVKAGSTGKLRTHLEAGVAGFGLVAVARGQAGAAAIYESGAEARKATLLDSGNTGTIRKEVQAAGARGLCVADNDSISEAVYVMEDCAPPPGPREYDVLATTKTETLERELNAAAGRGFRLVPASLVGIEKRALMGAYNYETVAVLEKKPDAPPTTYRVVGAVRLGTFAKELQAVAAEGFRLVGVTIGPKETVAVLERAGQ